MLTPIIYFAGVQILKQLLEIKNPSRSYKQTCLVCNIDDGKNPFNLAKSDQGDKHAEELLLEELRKLIDLRVQTQKLMITIFMNGIPCSLPEHNCANKFTKFQWKYKVKLTLYITSLCEEKKETCTKGTNIHPGCRFEKTTDRKRGLEGLKKHCTVEGPSKGAWEKLFDIMNMCEDDHVIQEFWKTYESKTKGSRKHKEIQINNYLKHI